MFIPIIPLCYVLNLRQRVEDGGSKEKEAADAEAPGLSGELAKKDDNHEQGKQLPAQRRGKVLACRLQFSLAAPRRPV
jgi:hypothetical protein